MLLLDLILAMFCNRCRRAQRLTGVMTAAHWSAATAHRLVVCYAPAGFDAALGHSIFRDVRAPDASSATQLSSFLVYASASSASLILFIGDIRVRRVDAAMRGLQPHSYISRAIFLAAILFAGEEFILGLRMLPAPLMLFTAACAMAYYARRRNYMI